jgi:hypothetical protein
MSRSSPGLKRLAESAGLLLALLLPGVAGAGEIWTLGGDARAYQFLELDDPDGARRDAELGVFRLKLLGRFTDEVSGEAHAVASVISPALPAAVSIASGTTRHLLNLQHTVIDERDVQVLIELDRLDVKWERREFTLVAGRQAITWGVNFFWPVLDLFAPFPPQRTDREYKPGVDAIRLVVPVGELSQIEVVAAGQGPSIEDDGSVGALPRFHLGPADVGLMAGRFHRDTVAGGFVTADVRGTGLRAEIAFTDSGDPGDAAIDRKQFWRATVGLDRQLTPVLSLTAELSWNGFGSTNPKDYPLLASADRVQRGEVSSLGRYYLGSSLTWQVHPLVSVTGTALVNLGDGSALLLPHVDWSLSDNLAFVLGGAFGIGRGPRPDGVPGSEYGSAPQVLYAAIKAYF